MSNFKGKLYVDIREFYEADYEMKPTKKGVSLSMEAWDVLKKNIQTVDDLIKKH